VTKLACVCVLAACAALWLWPEADEGHVSRADTQATSRGEPQPATVSTPVTVSATDAPGAATADDQHAQSREWCHVYVLPVNALTNKAVWNAQRVYAHEPDGEYLWEADWGKGVLQFKVETPISRRIRVEAGGYEPGEWLDLKIDTGEATRYVSAPLRPERAPTCEVELFPRTDTPSSIQRFKVMWGVVGAERDGQYSSRICTVQEGFRITLPTDRYWFRVSAPKERVGDHARCASLWMPELFDIHLPGGVTHRQDVILYKGGRIRVVMASETGSEDWFVERIGARLATETGSRDAAGRRGFPIQRLVEWHYITPGERTCVLPAGRHRIVAYPHWPDRDHNKILMERDVVVRRGEDLRIDIAKRLAAALRRHAESANR